MPSLTSVNFDQLSYRRVDYNLLVTDLRRARLRLRLAFTAAAAQHAVMDMQTALRHYHTQATLARIRHDLKTDDPFYAAEQAYYDQTDAKVSQQCQVFYTTLLNSAHRADLEKSLGSLIFRKAKNLRETIQASVLEDCAEENQLASTYQLRMSEAVIQIDGQPLTLAQLAPLQESPDRPTRQQAQRALAGWLQNQREGSDQLFDRLVAVRSKISRKLGLASFTELGYKRLERFDIGRAQVDVLRQAVIRYIVPMTSEIRRLQRHRLGLEHLMYYDLPVLLPEGNPKLQIPISELPGATARLMSDLTGQEHSFLQSMLDHGYMDVGAREHKTQGGYNATLIDHGRSFIFMNAGGTSQDAATLIHESGHAYAGMRSLANLPLLEYHLPTLETCEIHSTAMEYLAYPHMERLFGSGAENYTLQHMTEALLFIPYGCLVDEFQHRVYDQPGLSFAQRNATWRELERAYLPDLDYGGEPFYEDGCSWQKKEHIFVAPFYYIDYVIAQIAALEIWQTSRKSSAAAWQKYDKLCSLGGRDTFCALLAQAEIASPFDTGTIKKAAYAAADFLDL